MNRVSSFVSMVAVVVLVANAAAADVTGTYMEARTCQVYTGPCFANAEVGLAGMNALMAWNIDEGQQDGVDLSGLKVVVVVNSSETLGFGGVDVPKTLKSVILVDDKASATQRTALVSFAKQHAGRAAEQVLRIDAKPIEMALNTSELRGKLSAGKEVKLVTRKVRDTDCICGNESGYYAPLAKVENFAPGVAIEGEFKGRGLGTRWSIPGSRSAYMATFAY